MLMKKILIAFTCTIFLLASLGACNSGQTKSAESLRTSAKAYGKLIRWNAYEEAANYIKLRDGSEVVFDADLLKEIRVTRYEVSSMILNETNDQAAVLAEISYYHERVNSVHNIRDQQVWWQDENGIWRLDGQLPPFVK